MVILRDVGEAAEFAAYSCKRIRKCKGKYAVEIVVIPKIVVGDGVVSSPDVIVPEYPPP